MNLISIVCPFDQFYFGFFIAKSFQRGLAALSIGRAATAMGKETVKLKQVGQLCDCVISQASKKYGPCGHPRSPISQLLSYGGWSNQCSPLTFPPYLPFYIFHPIIKALSTENIY